MAAAGSHDASNVKLEGNTGGGAGPLPAEAKGTGGPAAAEEEGMKQELPGEHMSVGAVAAAPSGAPAPGK